MAAVIKRINEYNSGIPLPLKEFKWNAMKESPFRFYRGACHLFAEDFVKLYKYKPKVKSWICGDLHFENFGSYKGENRLVYFDLADFDEAILAGPEPEVARFLTSIIIAASQMKVAAIGLHKALHDIMDAYTTTLQAGKALMLEEEVAHGKFKKYFEHLNTFDRQSFIDKRTYKQNGAMLLKPDNIHFMQLDDTRKAAVYKGLSLLLDTGRFQHFVFVDAAFRLAGTGSLGLERYCVLCYSKKKGKHYLIDIKEARKSCYKGLVKTKQPLFKNEADRVNTTGYIMQFNSPAFLSTMKIEGKWYMVKEMQLMSDRMSLADFDNDFGSLSAVAGEMAVLMAYAHIRSSGHLGASTADDLRIFAEKKQWQRDIIEVSGALAKKNNKYYREFIKAE
ncbi:MAG: DUF2252 family protein [Chitinophagales bacterium]